MKIMICGSMHFANEMLDVRNKLEEFGHEVLLPGDIHECVANPNLKDNFEKDYEVGLKHCIEKNLLRDGLKKVEQSDAVLVLNHPKNDIEGYIGTAVLMELGVAFNLGKKIFILNDIDRKQKYALEVDLTEPIFLQGDLSKIS